MLNQSVYFLSGFLLSVCLTFGAVKLLGCVGFWDIPNHRSMHKKATPTSGGITIGISYWIAICLSQFEVDFLWPWLITSSAYLVIGALDDFQSRTVSLRLFLQISIGSILAAWLIFNTTSKGDDVLKLVTVIILFSIFMVGAVNLFNFMDGSDGLAASQSAVYFLLHAYLFNTVDEVELTILAIVLCGIVSGFLVFNWSPAKIFMGDSGSYFLGSICVSFAFFSYEKGLGVYPSLILASPFLCDSILTLVHRFFSGESWWEAHRSHVYQILLTHGLSPSRLILALMVLHFFFLGPLFFFSMEYPALSFYCTMMAFGTMGFICYYLRKLYSGTV